MTDKRRLDTKWPSSVTAYDGKVKLSLQIEEVSDFGLIEMTPMQAMELGLQLIQRSKDCLKSIVNG